MKLPEGYSNYSTNFGSKLKQDKDSITSQLCFLKSLVLRKNTPGHQFDQLVLLLTSLATLQTTRDQNPDETRNQNPDTLRVSGFWFRVRFMGSKPVFSSAQIPSDQVQ